ncbi:MAG: hypothetical protein WBA42_07135 [Mesorhizobium sp.]
MNAFAAGIDAIFADPNMTRTAVYRAGGAGTGASVRVIFRAPDRVVNWNEGRFVADTLFIDVRVSEVPNLAQGDTFAMAAPGAGLSCDFEADAYAQGLIEVFEVRSDPVRDGERLCWAAEVREL